MKRQILFLLVISFTALPAQNYQYFTAKQGIPKAMEIAKQYFQSDSVELYSIKAVRWTIIPDTVDSIHIIEQMVLFDSMNPYNDTTGKSLYWYFRICDSNDTCYDFRLWNKAGVYQVDSVFKNFKPYNNYYGPLHEKDILIDTDSLVHCMKNNNCFNLLNYSELFFWINNHNQFNMDSIAIWEYNWVSLFNLGWEVENINTKNCECFHDALDVPEKNKTDNTSCKIISNPNSENITIETNAELIQEAELSLYDQLGVLHFAVQFRSKSYELNTYNFPSGMYFLLIKYGGNVVTKPVIIVH